MRLSILVDKHDRAIPEWVGLVALEAQDPHISATMKTHHPGAQVIRLPRKLVSFIKATCEQVYRDLLRRPGYIEYRAATLLREMTLPHLLELVDAFQTLRRAWRRRPRRPWRVGDPCYVLGEGWGNLFFLQEVHEHRVVVNDCWEAKRKIERLAFVDFWGHVRREAETQAQLQARMAQISDTKIKRALELELLNSQRVTQQLETYLR